MDLSNKPNEVLVDVLTDIISELRTAQDLGRRDALKAAARAIQKELQRRQMLPEADDSYDPDSDTYRGEPMPTLDKFEHEPLDPEMPSDEAPISEYQKNQLEKIIKSSLIELTPQQRKVIILRFGLLGYNEHTRRQVAQILERSYERITQLENDALRKLKLMRSAELRQARADISAKSYRDGSVVERKLSKGEEKTREKYVKGMKKSRGDFEKRYGKDAESVMYATATKMAKKKNESVEESLMAEWQQEKQQPLNEIGIPTIIRYLATKKIRDRAAHDAARKAGTQATSKKSPEVQAQNRANAEKRLGDYRPEMKPQIQQTPKPSNTIDQPIKSLQTTSSKRPMPASTKKPANDPTVESLMDQWLQEKKDPCWKGYKQIGMKKKGDKDVPNCVPTKGKKKS